MAENSSMQLLLDGEAELRATPQITYRDTSPAMEALLYKPYPVLDHGFIRLMDYMGDEGSIVQAARVSYGKGTKQVSEDRSLLRYLIRHWHTTPLEMCLAGNTPIPTFSSNGATVKHYTIEQLAQAFAQGGRENSWVKLVKIRTVDTQSGIVESTKIKRAWKTGDRPCYKIKVGPYQREIVATDNHPFLCDDGNYRTLAELRVGDRVALNGLPATDIEIESRICSLREAGGKLDDITNITGIPKSTVWKVIVRNGLGQRMPRKTGFLKKKTGDHKDPRAIARRTLGPGICACCATVGRDIHHIDENPANNDIGNLIRLCPKHHRHIHTRSLLERVFYAPITSIEYVGNKEVYDLEVISDNHNFVAAGFVVHNCEIKVHVKMPIFVARQWIRHRTASVNEYSGRYSILDREFYVPEASRLGVQSSTNKQGTDSNDLSPEQQADVLRILKRDAAACWDGYDELLSSHDLSRELARINLPLSAYTQWYWKIDLKNLLHFLALRADSHAQEEIRVYAQIMCDMVEAWLPNVFQAWDDYHPYRKAHNFSGPEMDAIRAVVAAAPGLYSGDTEEKMEALRQKLLTHLKNGASSREIKAFFSTLGIAKR